MGVCGGGRKNKQKEKKKKREKKEIFLVKKKDLEFGARPLSTSALNPLPQNATFFQSSLLISHIPL